MSVKNLLLKTFISGISTGTVGDALSLLGDRLGAGPDVSSSTLNANDKAMLDQPLSGISGADVLNLAVQVFGERLAGLATGAIDKDDDSAVVRIFRNSKEKGKGLFVGPKQGKLWQTMTSCPHCNQFHVVEIRNPLRELDDSYLGDEND